MIAVLPVDVISDKRTRLSGVRHILDDHLLGAPREVVSAPELSRAPIPWWRRTDPYWQVGLFDAHHDWACEPIRSVRTSPRLYGNATQMPGRDVDPPPEKADEILADVDADTLELWRKALALITLAGVISDEQAVTSLAVSRESPKPDLSDLAALGAIEGSWHHPPGMPHPRLLAWRARNGVMFDRICAGMIFDGVVHEYFGGVHPLLRMPGARHVRHQCLANELALRALEASEEWIGWVPEAACTPERFVPPGHPARARQHSMRSDGCLLRVDCARVFIEIQASSSKPKTAEKVQRWSRLFTEGAFGGVVLFVAASPHHAAGRAVAAIKEAIEEHAPLRARHQLLIGEWHDYSPDHAQITEDGWKLRAAYHDGKAWNETDALSVEVDPTNVPLTSIYPQIPNYKFNPSWVAYRVPSSSKKGW